MGDKHDPVVDTFQQQNEDGVGLAGLKIFYLFVELNDMIDVVAKLTVRVVKPVGKHVYFLAVGFKVFEVRVYLQNVVHVLGLHAALFE